MSSRQTYLSVFLRQICRMYASVEKIATVCRPTLDTELTPEQFTILMSMCEQGRCSYKLSCKKADYIVSQII